jgi:hypothetical protein
MSARRWPHLYRVLDVHHEADTEEIQDAFLARLAEARGDDARAQAVTEAWTVLGDPERRAAYDRGPASLPGRELAAAVRPLAVWVLLWLVSCAVLVGLGARHPGSIAGPAAVIASTPYGWRAVGRPLRWLELDLIRGAWVLRGILALAVGVYVAPVVVILPLLRRRSELAAVAASLVGRLGAWRKAR